MKVIASVSVPPHGMVSARLWMALRRYERVTLQPGFDVQLVEGKTTAEVRNLQVLRFLETDGDVFLMADNDAEPTADQLMELERHLRPDWNDNANRVDVVAGWGLIPHDGQPGIPNVFYPPDKDTREQAVAIPMLQDPRMHEVTGGGVGCHLMAIRRWVLEAFATPNAPEHRERRNALRPSPLPMLWFEDPLYPQGHERVGQRSRGNDLLFCLRAAELGARIWCDTSIHVDHRQAVGLRAWWERENGLRRQLADQSQSEAGPP